MVRASSRRTKPDARQAATEPNIPVRSIGGHRISRLIIGGNPFSSIAHSEPMVYSRDLFQHYFTRDKIVETLVLAERCGINTFLGRIDEHVIGFLKQFEKTAGHTMPWIAQTAKKPQQGATRNDIRANIQLAADNGAMGIYVHGESVDYLVEQGKTDDVADHVHFIRELGLIAGTGAHKISTVEACQKAGLKPDFYMKTFNRLEYCCPDYGRTREMMAAVDVPWIAFKVLAAGRMQPQEGFAAAFNAGAAFLCVGMFDFQVEQNVVLVKSLLG